MEVSTQLLATAALPPQTEPQSIQCIESGLTAALDELEKRHISWPCRESKTIPRSQSL